MLTKLPGLLLTVVLSLSVFSCTTEKLTVDERNIQKTHEIMQDKIVLNAHAMMGTDNKTLLKTGCPLMYHFKWKSDDPMEDSFNLQLKEFCVGRMPFAIWFTINCKFVALNGWEKQEYPEDGWIKFEGYGGNTIYDSNTEDYESGDGGGGSVIGYLNVDTWMIEFVTNFNVMNMSSEVFMQKIDHSRVDRFDAEFAQYEADLKKYKEEHGIR